MAALSWPGHYQAPWMPVFSSFVGRGIDSHSPGNDCHTSAKSQPPTGAKPHQTRLSRGPAREPLQQTPPDPHLQLSSRHPPLCSQPLPPLRKDVLPGPHFPLWPPSLLSFSLSSSACVNLQPAETQRAAKVFKNALWTHDKGRLTLLGVRKYTGWEWNKFNFTFNLKLCHT